MNAADELRDHLRADNEDYLTELLDRALAEAAQGAAPRAEGLDVEALRMERGWPTPISMRHAADALDKLAIPKYGDVLRWVADLCDGAAPRAEGLDYDALAAFIDMHRIDAGICACGHWDKWAPLTFGAHIATEARHSATRLSRPSDERVPESEETR